MSEAGQKRSRRDDSECERDETSFLFFPLGETRCCSIATPHQSRCSQEQRAWCKLEEEAACGLRGLLCFFCVEETAAAAAFGNGPSALSVSPREASQITAALLSQRQWRCGKHGPFPCLCAALHVLGRWLRCVCDEFCRNILLTSECAFSDACGVFFPGSASGRSNTSMLLSVVVDPDGSLRVEFYSRVFPFPVPYATPTLLKLRSIDTQESATRALFEGWVSLGLDPNTSKPFSMPRCSDCSAVGSLPGTCHFCSRRFCAKCKRQCPTCRQYSCCVACSSFEMIDRVAMSLCPGCIDQ